MFPNSKNGDVELSEKYKTLLIDINDEVVLSHEALSTANSKKKNTFTNADHQRRVMQALSKIGISLSRQKGPVFMETESSIFRLIDSTNATFSGLEEGGKPIPIFDWPKSYL